VGHGAGSKPGPWAVTVAMTSSPAGDVDVHGGRRGASILGGSVSFGVGVDALLELGVDALGFGELVFQDDDAAGRVQCGALVDQVAGALGQAQLVAGIAAVAAGRALRSEEFGGVQAAQEPGGDAEDLGGPAHAVSRIVLIVQLAVEPGAEIVSHRAGLGGMRVVVRWVGAGSNRLRCSHKTFRTVAGV